MINDTERDFWIQKGDDFNEEEERLNNLEAEINDYIKSLTPSVGKYDTIKGGYDDGGLHYEKGISWSIYDEKKEYGSYRYRPYYHRVDVSSGKSELSYYLGITDIYLNNAHRVFSVNSGMGRMLMNINYTEFENDGKTYDIELSRELDIQNGTFYGYRDIRTKYDLIESKGVTDPLLLRIMRMRRQQRQLLDIVISASVEQLHVVDASLLKNMIVQGCAGSGKTVVMIRRLAELNYKNPNFDFGKALILTPNEHFNTYLRSIVESQRLGFIPRLTVDEYYKNMLKKYSDDLAPERSLAKESSENPAFVRFVYSDEFLDRYNNAYDNAVSEQALLIDEMIELSKRMGLVKPKETAQTDAETYVWLMEFYRYLDRSFVDNIDKIDNAKDVLNKRKKEKDSLVNDIRKKRTRLKTLTQEVVDRAKGKIENDLEENANDIQEQNTVIDGVHKEIAAIIRNGVPERDQAIRRKEREIRKAETRISILKDRENQLKEADALDIPSLDEISVLKWLGQIKVIVPSVEDENRLLQRMIDDLVAREKELSGADQAILEAQTYLDKLEEMRYSKEIEKLIDSFKIRVSQYAPMSMFNDLYKNACNEFIETNSIKRRTGTRRFDLYARLLFAIDYYGKVVGDASLISIDEGQDLAINEYKLINRLNSGKAIINIYGDTNQMVNEGRGMDDWEELSDVIHPEQYVLSQNYRNAYPISIYCKDTFNVPIIPIGLEGDEVEVVDRGRLKFTISNLKKTDDRVAIIYSNKVVRKKHIEEEIQSYTFLKVGLGLANDISVVSIDESKGLEFEMVIVLTEGMTRNEQYVACSRALKKLVVIS